MSEPVRLYTISEIATMLGVSRMWVQRHHSAATAPSPEFVMPSIRGKQMSLLWTEESLDRWRAYRASPSVNPGNGWGNFSDHNAVNQIGSTRVTWKLWWRPTSAGTMLWWFSTPRGWYCSEDDGTTWQPAETHVRPSDFRYICVGSSGQITPSVASVLRSAEKLRCKIERT